RTPSIHMPIIIKATVFSSQHSVIPHFYQINRNLGGGDLLMWWVGGCVSDGPTTYPPHQQIILFTLQEPCLLACFVSNGTDILLLKDAALGDNLTNQAVKRPIKVEIAHTHSWHCLLQHLFRLFLLQQML